MADPITWETLAKSITDLTTIVEQIEADILTHNLDASAHGQSGEVMFEHRTASLLDHLLGSVRMKYLANDHFLGFTLFESLDGWTIYGSPTAGIFSARISAAAGGVGNSCGINAYSWVGGPGFNPTKNPFFQTTVCFDLATYQLAYIVAGHYPVEGTGDCVGFRINNGTLYAYWTQNQVEFTSEITGITVTDINCYRVIVNSADEEIEFYVNGVLKYTLTANFPADFSDSSALFWIQTTVTTARTMRVVDWAYEQDR